MSLVPSPRSRLIPILCAVAVITLLCFVWFRSSAPASTVTDVVPEVSRAVDPVPPMTETPPAKPEGTPAAVEAPAVESAAATRDTELKAQLIGYWNHIENGEHWIENRSDGTARVLLKLDFVASLLYGKQVVLDLTWDVKDGFLSHSIVGGSPKASVDSLIKDFGKTRVYAVLEMTPERMLLENQGVMKKKDLWTRTPAPKEWADTTTGGGK